MSGGAKSAGRQRQSEFLVFMALVNVERLLLIPDKAACGLRYCKKEVLAQSGYVGFVARESRS